MDLNICVRFYQEKKTVPTKYIKLIDFARQQQSLIRRINGFHIVKKGRKKNATTMNKKRIKHRKNMRI